jgi:hypothetical protein
MAHHGTEGSSSAQRQAWLLSLGIRASQLTSFLADESAMMVLKCSCKRRLLVHHHCYCIRVGPGKLLAELDSPDGLQMREGV